MSTTTTNYGLIKPGTDDPILVGQLNDNMDTIDTVLKDHSDKIDAAALGIKFKGEVNYYSNLPNDAEIGDAYTVKYAGSSGTTPDGTEYVWGTVSGTNQWINFSKDSYTKAEVDALLALKQNALNSAQLAAVNSGIDSAKVAQIATNASDISDIETALGSKVDKETGKGLSTNDFTTVEKTKLDDLAEIKSIGTGLNLDSSTGELTATGGGGGGGTSNYNDLTNKPQINSVTLSGNKSLSDLGITYESETAASGGTALSLVTTGEKYAWNNKQNAIDDLSTIRSGAALGATAVQPETGKGLSTNDYTTAEKTKLAGIAEGAEVNEIEGVKVNNTTINPDVNKVVNITVPTTAADVSALPASTKYAAALSLTINSSTFVMTGQLKDQNGDNLGTAQTIDLPLESVVVGGSYNSQTKKVVLTLQNGNTIEFSVADLVSGLQTELSASNKLNPAYINYDSTHRAVSDTEKSTWNGKQNALSAAQLAAVNSGIDSTKVEQIETNKNNISSVQEQANWNSNYGVKNICPYNSGTTSTGEGTVWNNLPIDIAAGTYSVSFSTDSMNSALVLLAADGATEVLRKTYSTTTVNDTFTISTAAKYIRLYIGAPKTVSNFMIHSFGDDTYQPYAMSNAELTAAIQALQAQLANQ